VLSTGFCIAQAQAQEPVLYVTEARGNRVAAYHIKPNGCVNETPFQRIDIKISGLDCDPDEDANPRRLAVHPNGCALYVATAGTIEVFQIRSDQDNYGRLKPFDDDADTLARMTCIKPANYQFLAVHPDGGSIYASLTALDQIRQYALNPDGSLQRTFTTPADGGEPVEKDPPVASCVQGEEDTRFQGLVVKDESLYAASHLPPQIAIFPLTTDEGAIESVTRRPTTNDPPQVPQVFTDCVKSRKTYAPRFSTSGKQNNLSKQFINPKTLLLDEPNGDLLYVADRGRGRIYGCPIADGGGLPDCPEDDKDDTNDAKDPNGTERLTMQSKKSAAYEQMALSDDGMLFASVFPAGRVRAFRPVPDEGQIKRRKGKSSDVFATPVAIAADGRNLYVAQGELDRIDVFTINDEGFANEDPRCSTEKIDGSFPNGVIVVIPCATTTTTTSTLAATTSTTITPP